MKDIEKNINLLDCTLRDGGYYNNWVFDKNFINKYLSILDVLKIKFCEIGFKSFKKFKSTKGECAYSSNKFLGSLKIPKNINIGVMINASDILNSNSSHENFCKKLFLGNKIIKFVRLACHFDEITKIENTIRWLNNNKFIVMINVMQASELNKNQIKKICHFLNGKIKILYLADSLGAFDKSKLIKTISFFNSYWSFDLGFHGHDNMGLAFNNSKLSIKNGIRWIDATLLGMGRGAGNTKLEDLYKFYNNKNWGLNKLNNFLKKNFKPLKKKYNWGKNYYYKYAAKNKIHPTYIQEILSDERYNKKDYKSIIQNLNQSTRKKYDPYALFLDQNKYLVKKKKSLLLEFVNKKNVLIIGPGHSDKKKILRLQNFALDKKLFIIALNTASLINEKLVDLRVVCHPLRLHSDLYFHKRLNTPLVCPTSAFSKETYKLMNSINLRKMIFDYEMYLNSKNRIIIKNNYCDIPKPLAIAYALSICIAAKSKKIYLAGFDSLKKNNIHNDDTNILLNLFKKNYKKNLIISLTSL